MRSKEPNRKTFSSDVKEKPSSKLQVSQVVPRGPTKNSGSEQENNSRLM